MNSQTHECDNTLSYIAQTNTHRHTRIIIQTHVLALVSTLIHSCLFECICRAHSHICPDIIFIPLAHSYIFVSLFPSSSSTGVCCSLCLASTSSPLRPFPISSSFIKIRIFCAQIQRLVTRSTLIYSRGFLILCESYTLPTSLYWNPHTPTVPGPSSLLEFTSKPTLLATACQVTPLSLVRSLLKLW